MSPRIKSRLMYTTISVLIILVTALVKVIVLRFYEMPDFIGIVSPVWFKVISFVNYFEGFILGIVIHRWSKE